MQTGRGTCSCRPPARTGTGCGPCWPGRRTARSPPRSPASTAPISGAERAAVSRARTPPRRAPLCTPLLGRPRRRCSAPRSWCAAPAAMLRTLVNPAARPALRPNPRPCRAQSRRRPAGARGQPLAGRPACGRAGAAHPPCDLLRRQVRLHRPDLLARLGVEEAEGLLARARRRRERAGARLTARGPGSAAACRPGPEPAMQRRLPAKHHLTPAGCTAVHTLRTRRREARPLMGAQAS
jgi:hypothetical protein